MTSSYNKTLNDQPVWSELATRQEMGEHLNFEYVILKKMQFSFFQIWMNWKKKIKINKELRSPSPMTLRRGVLVQLLPEMKISALGHKYSLIVLKPLNVPIKTKRNWEWDWS